MNVTVKRNLDADAEMIINVDVLLESFMLKVEALIRMKEENLRQ